MSVFQDEGTGVFTFQTGLRDFPRLRFSHDARYLAVCDGDGTDGEGYEVWTIPPESGPVHRDSDTVLRGCEWNPVAAELYVPHNSEIRIVTATGEPVQTVKKAGWVQGMAFAPAGDRLATFSPYVLTGWNRVRGKWRSQWSAEVKKTGALKNDSFESVAVFPDGRRIVTLISRRVQVPYQDGKRKAWYWGYNHLLVQRDLTTGQVLGEHPLKEEDAPHGVRTRSSITPDGAQIIGFRARSVLAWPLDPVKPARRTPVSKKDVQDVVLHPSGRWVLVANGSPEVSVWDTVTWKQSRTFNWKIGDIECADISADGLLAAVASPRGKVAVWDWDL